MKRIALHFPLLFKALLYALLATSFATGTLWFALHRWVRIAGDFGDEPSAWEPVLLKIHGASAMCAMIFFGYVLATHVAVAMRTRRNRVLGFALVAALCFQIGTGWGLFYFGGETLRAVTSWAHLGTGLTLPAVLAAHIVWGRSHRLK